MEIAEKLEGLGIKVDLLITVDAAKGPVSGNFLLPDLVDRKVPANVNQATVYYQDNPSLIGSHGNEATAIDPQKTSVLNIKITDKDINHDNIDERVKPLVIEEIKQKILENSEVKEIE